MSFTYKQYSGRYVPFFFYTGSVPAVMRLQFMKEHYSPSSVFSYWDSVVCCRVVQVLLSPKPQGTLCPSRHSLPYAPVLSAQTTVSSKARCKQLHRCLLSIVPSPPVPFPWRAQHSYITESRQTLASCLIRSLSELRGNKVSII